jgi:hypothetical protein
MNTRTPHDHDRFEREAQEWLAQERAREQERRGLPLDGRDPAGRDRIERDPIEHDPIEHDPGARAIVEYRLIARALRTPAMEPLPSDLAAQIVRHVAAVQALGERVERWMLRILGLLLAAISAGAVAVYGASWAPAFAALLPDLSGQALGWGGLAAICLAVSLLGQGMGRWLRPGDLQSA